MEGVDQPTPLANPEPNPSLQIVVNAREHTPTGNATQPGSSGWRGLPANPSRSGLRITLADSCNRDSRLVWCALWGFGKP